MQFKKSQILNNSWHIFILRVQHELTVTDAPFVKSSLCGLLFLEKNKKGDVKE